jgi:CRP/FNR family cyclic AMP-dependent transcriptional regulator
VLSREVVRLHSTTVVHAIPYPSDSTDFRSGADVVNRKRYFRAGATLFLEGDSPECVFQILKGRVHLETSGRAGAPVLLRVATEGCFLGISSILLQQPYEGSAITVEPTTVEVLPRAAFRQLMDEIPSFAAKATRVLSREYSEMVEQSKRLRLAGNTNERVARVLVDCMGGRRSGTQFAMPYTHDEIGSMIGRSRETVTRTLTLFKQQGLIEIAGRTLNILRPDCLRSIAGGTHLSTCLEERFS